MVQSIEFLIFGIGGSTSTRMRHALYYYRYVTMQVQVSLPVEVDYKRK